MMMCNQMALFPGRLLYNSQQRELWIFFVLTFSSSFQTVVTTGRNPDNMLSYFCCVSSCNALCACSVTEELLFTSLLSCVCTSGWVLPPASEAATPSTSRWAAEFDPMGPSKCGSSGSFTSSAVDRRILCALPRSDNLLADWSCINQNFYNDTGSCDCMKIEVTFVEQSCGLFVLIFFFFFGPHIYQKVMDTKIDLKKK